MCVPTHVTVCDRDDDLMPKWGKKGLSIVLKISPPSRAYF